MDYPDKFYGIGPDVIEADEEAYTKVDYTLEAAVQYEVVPDLFAGLQVDWENFTLEDIEPGGFFDSGTILGSESGVVSGAGLLVTFDSRDDIFVPGKGLYAEVAAMSYGEGTGSDFTYDNITLDLRQFVTLGSVTLGFQQYLHLSDGEPPFHRLAQLGGSELMRGYFMGQYRDKNLAAVQVESRVPLSARWGLVFFGSAGSVAPTPGDLDVDSFLTAGGTGLRFRLTDQEMINLRVDLAWGEDGNSGVYFTIKEAF
jgi:outer membrane protein assembly factor BamA